MWEGGGREEWEKRREEKLWSKCKINLVNNDNDNDNDDDD